MNWYTYNREEEEERQKRLGITPQYINTPYGIARNSSVDDKLETTPQSNTITETSVSNDNQWKIRKDRSNGFNLAVEKVINAIPDQNNNSSVFGQILGAAKDLGSSYIKMINADMNSTLEDQVKGTIIDNYYHCVGHNNAAKRGYWGQKASEFIGNKREDVDFVKNTINNVLLDDNIDAQKDYENDMQANAYGRQQAISNPNLSAEEVCAKYKPKNLDEEEQRRRWGYPRYHYYR